MKPFELHILIANLFLIASFFKEGVGGLFLVGIGIIWCMLSMLDFIIDLKLRQFSNKKERKK